MMGLYVCGLKTDYVASSQWDSYCRTEGILHRNINLLDSSMIIKKREDLKKNKHQKGLFINCLKTVIHPYSFKK